MFKLRSFRYISDLIGAITFPPGIFEPCCVISATQKIANEKSTNYISVDVPVWEP